MARLSLCLLGGFVARLDETLISGIKTDKARALLVYLAVEHKRPQRREALADLLWPGYLEASARASLRHALANLRQALKDAQADPPFLLVEGDTIQLNPASDFYLDVAVFKQRVDASTSGANDLQSIITNLQASIALYRGAFLEDFTLKDCPDFDAWAAAVRHDLRQRVLAALYQLAEAYERQGELEKAGEFARRQLEIEPWREEAQQQMMRVLARQGMRSQALAQYEACKRSLKQELGVEPSAETTRLFEQIRDGRLLIQAESPGADPAALEKPRHNLPIQRTSFIGREQELARVTALLNQSALVTVTGPGGVGKTRLALQAAETLLDQFPEGVWTVDLEALSDPERVTSTAARAIGMHLDAGPQAQELLVEYCRKRRLLLLLDNCEHLVEACARLAEVLLGACLQVKILTTSREMLGVSGEAVYPLLPFTAPGKEDSLESLSKNEAVRLFVERAAKLEPGFALTSRNAAAIGRICAQLDGIPLAVELAAAWVRTLPVEQISARLRESLDYLRGASRAGLHRHQTMRGCLDWSYNLLTPPEQNLLQALSVFAGSYTLEAAEAVCAESCASPMAVLELLDQLAQKSLVLVLHHPEHETRYRLLEPVRQYAQEKLHYSGDTDVILDRHLAFYQELAEQAAPHLRARRQIEWLRRLERELPNLRQALDWACSEGGPMERIERGLRLGADLRFFWQSRVRYQEGVLWLERLLELERQRRGEQPISASMAQARAWGLNMALGLRGMVISSADEAKVSLVLNESETLCRSLGEAGRRGLAYTRVERVFNTPKSSIVDDIQQLKEIYNEAVAIGDKFLMAECCLYLGIDSQAIDDFNSSEEYLLQCLAISQEVGDWDVIPYVYAQIAINFQLQGNPEKAQTFADEVRRRIEEVEADLLHSTQVGYGMLHRLAWCAGDYSQAEKDSLRHIEIVGRYQWIERSMKFGPAAIAASSGDYRKARLLLEQCINAHPSENLSWGDYWGIHLFGELDWEAENFAQATRRFMELKRATEIPDFYQIFSEWGLAKVSLSQGNWRVATEHLILALNSQLERTNFYPDVFEDNYAAVRLTALLSASQQHFECAARLLGSADRSYQRYGKTFLLYRRQLIEKTIAETRATLDEAAFTTAWEEGKAMRLEQALKYALQVLEEFQAATSE